MDWKLSCIVLLAVASICSAAVYGGGVMCNPPTITYGKVTWTSLTPESVATYSCDNGYRLYHGHATQTCLATGDWSGRAPYCEPVTCPQLKSMSILYGSVKFSTTTPGSKATYSCSLGYRVEGEPTRICQDNGDWSGITPRCTRVDCGAPENIKNGWVRVPATHFSVPVFYQCNEGYFLVGIAERTCGEDGFWSGKVPVCKAKPCDVGGHLYQSGDKYKVKCNDCQCLAGVATCTKLPCPDHAGTCPSYRSYGSCHSPCTGGWDCAANERCCPTICGKNCEPAVTGEGYGNRK